jgi:multidrug resistance efflux pump
MTKDNTTTATYPELREGYQPKGYITKVVQGQPVKIPVSQLKINPPQGGTAAVQPKK